MSSFTVLCLLVVIGAAVPVWSDGTCKDCPPNAILGMIGGLIGGLIVLAVVLVVVFILKKKNIIGFNCSNNQECSINEEHVSLQGPANASNRSDSNASSSQVDGTTSDDGLNTVTAGRERSADSDSGLEIGSTPDSSSTNSQDAVNHMCEDSSSQSQPADAQSLLQQTTDSDS